MAYHELIKNFNRIREYMREFYVYGFKSRDEYRQKSARSYDDERRRLESWLGDYMRFRQTPDGKNVFLSIDSRTSLHNPLYAAWKAKSFTDGDITLHFLLFDILCSPDIRLSLGEITEKIDARLLSFPDPKMFDVSTVRKKLNEYVTEGLIVAERQGKTMFYRRAAESAACGADLLDFFSEVSPCGVIGSFLLDKEKEHPGHFAFKHHYITSAMDSEIVCSLLSLMGEKRYVTLEILNRRKDRVSENHAVPLRLMISVQNGRQYLTAYSETSRRFLSYRIDNILSVRGEGVYEHFDDLRHTLDKVQKHMWGISTQSVSGARMEHVEFTVRYADDESYIPRRLEREKRGGTVERIDKNTSKFTADVFDATEMIPWIRTFICRITDIRFSNRETEAQFKNDLLQMYAMYGMEGGETE